MPIVPILRPREVVKTFEKLGWEVVRQKGSHIIMVKQGHIARGTLGSLIAKAGVTIQEFMRATGE